MKICKSELELETKEGFKSSDSFKTLKERYGYDEAKQMYSLVTKPEFIKLYGDWEQEIRLGRKPFETALGEPPIDLIEDFYTTQHINKETVGEDVLDNLKKASNKILQNLEAQVTNLSRSNSDNKTELASKLKNIQEDIRSKRTIIGIINYINFAKSTIDKYEDLILNKIDTIDTGYVRSIKSLIQSFDDLKQLKFELEKISQGNKLEDLYTDLSEEELVVIKPYIAKEIFPEIQSIVERQETILRKYQEYALDTSTTWLSLFTKKLPESTINNLLQRMRDVGSISRWAISMKNSNNPVIALIAKAIDTSKIKAQQITNDQLDEIAKQESKLITYLKKIGVNINNGLDTYSWMLEQDNKGNYTGKEVTNYLDKPFRTSMQEMFDSMPEILDNMTLPQIKATKKQRAEIITNWRDENIDMKTYNQFDNDFKDRVKALSEERITQSEFDNWENNNVVYGNSIVDDNGEEIRTRFPKIGSKYYKPADKWMSKKYLEIQNNPVLKEYYDFYIKLKETQNSKLPYKFRKNNELIGIRKDWVESLGEGNIKEIADKFYKNHIKLNQEEQNAYGEQDKSGLLVNHVPIFYTGRVLNPTLYSKEYLEEIKGQYIPIGDVSLDLSKNLALFSQMSNTYDAISDIVDNVEILKDVVAQADILQEDSLGNILKDKKTQRELTIKGSASNIFAQLNDYVKSNIYGQGKELEKIFGVNSKIIDKILSYNAFSSLGFSLFTPASNLIMGNVVRRISAMGSTNYTNTNFNKAQKVYALENATDLINDSFKQIPTNKINLLRKLFQIDSGYRSASGTKRVLENDYSRTLYHLGEHWVSSISMLSMLDNQGLLDKIKVINGRLVLPKELDNKSVINFILHLKEEIKAKDGSFRPEDRAAIERYVIGRVVFQFRKWIIPTVLDRFQVQLVDGKLQSIYNYQSEQELKGYYISGGEFLWNTLKDLRHAKFQVSTRWKELNDLDKKNLYKFGTETTFFISSGLIAAILIAANEDDDKKLAYLAFITNRLHTELGFYIPGVGLKDAYKILKSPVAATSTFGTMGDLFIQVFGVDYDIDEGINFKYNDIYQSGKNKGEYKVVDKLERNIPIINQISRLGNL